MSFADALKLKLPYPLRPYQWEGVRFLIEQGPVLLADEMGLGKTVQVSVALAAIVPSGDSNRALVIVPATLRLNWEQELLRWAPNLSVRVVRGDKQERRAHYMLPFNVLIASYEQVRADSQMIAQGGIRFDIVVLDEAQRIKNAHASVALACRIVPRIRSWALTGTPLENKVPDLLSVYQFLQPGLLAEWMSKTELHENMKPTFVRRYKRDVLPEMPPIQIQDMPLELEGAQEKAYRTLWKDRAAQTSNTTGRNYTSSMLALITRLKKLCNFDPESNGSVKMDTLTEIIDNLSMADHKLIVFSQFVETLRWIANQIGNQINTEIFHGGLNERTKNDLVTRFNNGSGPRVLLISLKAGGVGLNLQGASHVVLFDRWWNPSVEDQAINRAHRFGRDKKLHVYRFLVVDSIEERIDNILQEKRALFKEYVDDLADITPMKPLSQGDLTRILELDKATA